MLFYFCRHWAQMLCTLGLVPKAARKYMTLIFQRYTGDVTIVPAATLGDYLRLLSNPTTHYVERCINAGGLPVARRF